MIWRLSLHITVTVMIPPPPLPCPPCSEQCSVLSSRPPPQDPKRLVAGHQEAAGGGWPGQPTLRDAARRCARHRRSVDDDGFAIHHTPCLELWPQGPSPPEAMSKQGSSRGHPAAFKQLAAGTSGHPCLAGGGAARRSAARGEEAAPSRRDACGFLLGDLLRQRRCWCWCCGCCLLWLRSCWLLVVVVCCG